MTKLEDVLRRSLHDIPVAPAVADPLAAVDRRVRRARQRLLLAATVAVAAIAVAVAVPLATLGGHPAGRSDLVTNPHPSPSPSTAPAARPTVLRSGDALAATTTVDGSLWTLARVPGTTRERYVVLQQDATGRVLRRISVPGPARGIVTGDGAVWVYGGGDGGAPDGRLSVVTPNGQVHSLRFTGSGPYDAAFRDGVPYVTLASARRVAAIGHDDTGDLFVARSVRLSSQVTDLVSTSEGQLWVREDLRRRVVEIRDSGSRLSAGRSFPWSRGLVGADDSNRLWTSDGRNRLIGLDPRLAAKGLASLAEAVRIMVPGDVYAVVGDGVRGAYVATDRGVAYLRDLDAAMSQARSNPTAFTKLPGVTSMTAAPDGGVVVTTSDERELLWHAPATP